MFITFEGNVLIDNKAYPAKDVQHVCLLFLQYMCNPNGGR